jgi:hypothetical protein
MNDVNCMVDQYRIKYRAVGTSSWTQKNMGQPVGSCLWAANNTDKLILNLTPSTTYEYQMKAWYCDNDSSSSGSAWTAMHTFTTEDDCPNVGNLAVTTPSTTKATFTWDDSNGAYSFTRIKARVDTNNGVWFNVGGSGVPYGIFTKDKNNLSPGTSYRAQARTWCDPNGGAWKSPSWTSLIFWTQPTSIRLEGGTVINNLYVFPNPTRGVFEIQFSNIYSKEMHLYIYNVLGDVVLEFNSDKLFDKTKFDLTNQPKGIYTIELVADGVSYYKKLILQ